MKTYKIIHEVRKKKAAKACRKLILFVVVYFLIHLVAPTLFAVTSGPTQPEFKSWSPTDREDMVNFFDGSFQYSITLIDIPGPNGSYPIILSYRSGISVDQEASWVGLGWTLNPGSISRQVRGLPDDFKGTNNTKGDKLETKYKMKQNMTVGLGGSLGFKLYGADTAKASLALGLNRYYNNMKGFGWNVSLGLSGQASITGGQLRGLGGKLGQVSVVDVMGNLQTKLLHAKLKKKQVVFTNARKFAISLVAAQVIYQMVLPHFLLRWFMSPL